MPTAVPARDSAASSPWTRSRTPRPTTPGSRRSSPAGWSAAGLLPAPADPFPSTLTLALEKVETLRYGENPHQPAARYRRPGTTLADGLFGVERAPLQGKALSYNNVLDASAASALGPGAARAGGRDRETHEPLWCRGATNAARGMVGRAGIRPGERVRGCGRAHPPRRPGRRRGPRLDLPRGRDRARRGRRRADRPRLQAQSARAHRRGAGPGRAGRPPGPDGLDPDRWRHLPRERTGRRDR